MPLKRTQISLSPEDYRAAQKAAKKLGISLAQFFRNSLRQSLPASTSKSWMRYAGLVESGRSQTNEEIDELVYAQKD